MELILTIRDLSRSGPGVGEGPDGRIVFVPLSAPGDELRVRITKEDKRYLEGEILEVIKASPLRVEPRCPVFGRCGGCEWQHIPYELQWKKKVEGVKHGLGRVGLEKVSNAPWDLFPDSQIWNYRNRIQIRARDGAIGFYQRGSKQIVPMEECFIAENGINDRLRNLGKEIGEPEEEQKIELWTDTSGSTEIAINKKHGAGGFSQVHTKQNEALREWVDQQLGDGEVLLDLFGGQGNLSHKPSVRFGETHVVDTGTSTARRGAVSYHRAPVVHWLSSFSPGSKRIQMILDPPREGFGRDLSAFVQAVERLEVSRILWVACEVDPWARGLLKLRDIGFKIVRLGALDFFPQTHHVESLAVLEKK